MSAPETSLPQLRGQITLTPRVAIILGSGLGGLSKRLTTSTEFPYSEIEGWPVSGVEGHAGKLAVGLLGRVPVAILEGRAHLYEGYTTDEVTFGVRAAAALGVRTLVTTAAAGGIHASLEPGRLALIRDHINLQGVSPLRGPEFLDMTAAYSARLREAASRSAAQLEISLAEGVYAGLRGPNFETPAEIAYFERIGADMVGMSVVQETIAARARDMEVLGIACITNMAAGRAPRNLSHDEVLETGGRAARDLHRLLETLIPAIEED